MSFQPSRLPFPDCRPGESLQVDAQRRTIGWPGVGRAANADSSRFYLLRRAVMYPKEHRQNHDVPSVPEPIFPTSKTSILSRHFRLQELGRPSDLQRYKCGPLVTPFIRLMLRCAQRAWTTSRPVWMWLQKWPYAAASDHP